MFAGVPFRGVTDAGTRGIGKVIAALGCTGARSGGQRAVDQASTSRSRSGTVRAGEGRQVRRIPNPGIGRCVVRKEARQS